MQRHLTALRVRARCQQAQRLRETPGSGARPAGAPFCLSSSRTDASPPSPSRVRNEAGIGLPSSPRDLPLLHAHDTARSCVGFPGVSTCTDAPLSREKISTCVILEVTSTAKPCRVWADRIAGRVRGGLHLPAPIQQDKRFQDVVDLRDPKHQGNFYSCRPRFRPARYRPRRS